MNDSGHCMHIKLYTNQVYINTLSPSILGFSKVYPRTNFYYPNCATQSIVTIQIFDISISESLKGFGPEFLVNASKDSTLVKGSDSGT